MSEGAEIPQDSLSKSQNSELFQSQPEPEPKAPVIVENNVTPLKVEQLIQKDEPPSNVPVEQTLSQVHTTEAYTQPKTESKGFFRNLLQRFFPTTKEPRNSPYDLLPQDKKLLDKQMSRRQFMKRTAIAAGVVAAAPAVQTVQNLAQQVPEFIAAADKEIPEQAAKILDNEPLLDTAINQALSIAKEKYEKKYPEEPHMHEPNSERISFLQLIQEAVVKAKERNPELQITYTPRSSDVEASNNLTFNELFQDLGEKGFTLTRILDNMTSFDSGYDNDRWNFIESVQEQIQGRTDFSLDAKVLLESSFTGFNHAQSILEITTEKTVSVTNLIEPGRVDEGMTVQPLDKVVNDILVRWDNGEQLTAGDILRDRIAGNNGELTGALKDTALILKILARNDPREYYMFIDDIGGMHAHNIVMRFGKGLKDQFSHFNKNWGVENPDPTREDANKNIANREGIPYHNFNIAALLSNFDTRFIKAMTVSQLGAWYHSQGELKAMANLEVLQNLNALQSYLQEFSKAPPPAIEDVE